MDDDLMQIRVSLSPRTGRMEKKFYVYVHIDPLGNIFYVGKGTGKRAWSHDRHDLWNRYIKRFGGEYSVQIIKENFTEDEAHDLEDDLIVEYGGQLVNWVNIGLDMDYKMYDIYWSLRKENEEIFKQTNEVTNLEEAVCKYKEIIARMIDYEQMETDGGKKYTGIAREVYLEFCNENKAGNIEMLNRLTICLKKLGRKKEMANVVNEYLKEFPGARQRSAMKKILKRAELPQLG